MVVHVPFVEQISEEQERQAAGEDPKAVRRPKPSQPGAKGVRGAEGGRSEWGQFDSMYNCCAGMCLPCDRDIRSRKSFRSPRGPAQQLALASLNSLALTPRARAEFPLHLQIIYNKHPSKPPREHLIAMLPNPPSRLLPTLHHPLLHLLPLIIHPPKPPLIPRIKATPEHVFGANDVRDAKEGEEGLEGPAEGEGVGVGELGFSASFLG